MYAYYLARLSELVNIANGQRRSRFGTFIIGKLNRGLARIKSAPRF